MGQTTRRAGLEAFKQHRVYREPSELEGEYKILYSSLEECEELAIKLGIQELVTNIRIDKMMLRSHGTPRIRATHEIDFDAKN